MAVKEGGVATLECTGGESIYFLVLFIFFNKIKATAYTNARARISTEKIIFFLFSFYALCSYDCGVCASLRKVNCF